MVQPPLGLLTRPSTAGHARPFNLVCLASPLTRPLYGGVVVCPVQAGDEFTSELVRIHETIEKEGGPRQPVCLAINRSDYMLHAPQDGVTKPHLLQVSERAGQTVSVFISWI